MVETDTGWLRHGSTDPSDDLPIAAEVMEHLGPVAVTSALRDADDTIVDFRFDLVNPAFCEVLHESADALLGHGLLELYPSHVELGLFDAYCAVVETGAPFVDELPWFNERNARGFFEVRVVRFRDGYLMTGRDVTDARMGEQVRRIFEQSRDGIVGVDQDMVISTWNTGAALLYGLDEHEAIGEHISLITSAELRPQLHDQLDSVLANPGHVATFDVMGTSADGSANRVEVCASAIRRADGSVMGASLILRERHAGTEMYTGSDQVVLPVDVEVWCESTRKWVGGFMAVKVLADGSVVVRRSTDRSALPEAFPRERVRAATGRTRRG